MQDLDTFEVICFADFAGNSVLWRVANLEGMRELKRNSEINEKLVAWTPQVLIAFEEDKTIKIF